MEFVTVRKFRAILADQGRKKDVSAENYATVRKFRAIFADHGRKKKPQSPAAFLHIYLLLSESEISICVVVRDVRNHLVDKRHLAARQLAVFDILAEHVAKDAAEIVVAGI